MMGLWLSANVLLNVPIPGMSLQLCTITSNDYGRQARKLLSFFYQLRFVFIRTVLENTER
jgi:hypothetical protein